MSEPTSYELDGPIATITLDRPDVRNVLSSELVESLGSNLQRALTTDDVRVVILTNAGNTFCAGADLKSPSSATSRHNIVSILRAIVDAPKPIVGRIAGHCIAGGVGLAAACDISIAVEDVRLGFTEVRVGVAPAIISVVCLPKLRRADALELFLTGEQFDAARAVELGLLNRAVPASELDDNVARIVESLLRGAPNAQRAAKELIRRVPEMPRDIASRWASRRSAELFASAEATAGIAAFRERRPAPWAQMPG
jgi:methylglutaconyl-CoA hydratase